MSKLLFLIAIVCPLFAQSNNLFPNTSAPVENYQPSRSELFAATSSNGKERPSVAGRTLYRWSLVSVLAANGADVASSWHMQEANPVVAGSGSQFGYTSLAIKSGFVGTSLVVQALLLRHHPEIYKKLAWLNYGTAGMLGGVAAYNMGNH